MLSKEKKQSAKRKRVWRLTMLAAALLALGTSAGGFYEYRQHQIRAHFFRAREDGLAALQAGDDITAVSDLAYYLQRYPNDPDALAGFAKARLLIPTESGQSTGDAIVALRHLLNLQPQRLAERRILLGLYLKAGYLTEALDTANVVISQAGEDAEVMAQQSRALLGLRRFTEADAGTKRWAQLAPNDIDAAMQDLWLMRQLQQPTKQIEYAGDKYLKDHPGDPKFEMVCGYAYALADDLEHSVPHLRAAASGTMTDIHFANILVAQLDAMGLHDESISVLQRLFDASKLPAARKTLARHYWEAGRVADLAKLLETVSPTDSASSDELLALRALALSQLGRDGETGPIRKTLADRRASATAAAWSAILDQLVGHNTPDPNRLLDMCQKALDQSPGDVYLSYFLGVAYAELGENDLAISTWQKAAELDRAWAMPLIRAADALSQAGRDESAWEAASEACRRAPKNLEAIVTLARVWSLCIEHGLHNQPEQLLDYVTEVQKQAPNEEQTLVIRVALLAHSGKLDEAKQVLHAAVTGKAPISESALLRLSAISEASNLELEDECVQRSLHENGMTPNLALVEAMRLFGTGKPEQGLKLFEQGRATADPTGKSLEWRLKQIGYLDLIGSPLATDEVVSLGDQYPKDLRVQQAVMATLSARKNRDFMERTIQRFHDLTGGQDVAWRVARARWLLDFTAGSAETTEACDLLSEATKSSPDLVEARVQLARAFERAGKPNDAIAQLSVAADLSPTSTSINLYLARLLQSRGDFERAREQLARVTATPLSNMEQRRQAAVLLAQQGESQQAIDLLEEADRQTSEGSSDLLLAELYRARDEPDKAETICKALLEKPNLSVIQYTSAIQFMADLLASQGRTEEADHVLLGLDKLKLDPGVRELVLADYCARHKSLNEALTHFRAAVQLTPKNPAAWKSIVVCELASGKVADALATAGDGLKQLPDEKSLKAILSESALIRKGANDQAVITLVGDLIRNPGDESAASETIRTIIESRRNGQTPAQLAVGLGTLSRSYPTYLPLQLMLANNYLRAGRLDDAIEAATRASQISPTAEDPYHILYIAFSSNGRWQEALDAARHWRNLSPGTPLPATLAIANAEMALHQPAAALSILQPYMANRNAPAYVEVAPSYARAQNQAGNSDTASLLEPLLNKGPAGRHSWISFAVQNLPPGEAAVWLDRVSPLIPSDATNEQIFLAMSWEQLYVRTDEPAWAEHITSLLEPLMASPQPPFGAVLTMGIYEEHAKDDVKAEALYRQALKIQADSMVAKNNLAMLLIRHEKGLNEAHELAATALEAHPEMPALYDTLAEIQEKEKAYSDAISNMQTAVQMQPNNARYRIRLAEDFVNNGQPDQARSVLKEMDDRHLDMAQLADPEKQQLNILRKSLERAATNASEENSGIIHTSG
jgi:tetratricopeptide (TPR) repeat protein